MQAITQKQINEFWQAHKRFLHTNLTTESQNQLTKNLSQLCSSNLDQAFSLFKDVELNAINNLLQYSDRIAELQQAIITCLKQSGKIYIIGCGASARLAVLLRRLWEISNPNLIGLVVSICSGGDISLISSVEQFEDSAEFGIKQLQQQEFTANDLLIGLSASGESPFILSSIEYALKNSKHTPWLVCNNSIVDIFKRNLNSIINSKIKTLALNVGEMALTGSTRLQATTAMQIAVGIALCPQSSDIQTYINQIYTMLRDIKITDLAKITHIESSLLKNQEYILYTTNENLLGLSMLSDITERAPTFNITQFENYNSEAARLSEDKKAYSPFYLCLTNTLNVDEAWRNLLGTPPICLNWEAFSETRTNYIQGFDISKNSPRAKNTSLPNKQYHENWIIDKDILTISLEDKSCSFEIPTDDLSATILFKMLLNSHSTLMFGVLGAYEGNLMLSLKPSNFKLMDRAIRYTQLILKNNYKLNIAYDKVAAILFEEINQLEPNQSIVMKVVQKIKTHI